jgi:hypothetical protein
VDLRYFEVGMGTRGSFECNLLSVPLRVGLGAVEERMGFVEVLD